MRHCLSVLRLFDDEPQVSRGVEMGPITQVLGMKCEETLYFLRARYGGWDVQVRTENNQPEWERHTG